MSLPKYLKKLHRVFEIFAWDFIGSVTVGRRDRLYVTAKRIEKRTFFSIFLSYF